MNLIVQIEIGNEEITKQRRHTTDFNVAISNDGKGNNILHLTI